MSEQFSQDITQPLTVPFSIDSFGLYALKIKASCKSGNLLGIRNGQDLRVEIDDIKFREIPPKDKSQYNNIPPAWNGTELKGLNKTVVFILPLNKGLHTLTYMPTNGARIEYFEVKPIQNLKNIVFDTNEKAEDGDTRPWYTFALINLPLNSLAADVSVSWHFFDGDDVKLVVDNKIEENPQSKIWKYWIWSARPWYIFWGQKREQKTFVKNLSQGIHYIEFWADKSPTLYQVNFDLGDFQLKHTPTVKDPKWTGEFSDDTDQMILARLIFGEARNQSKEAMIGVAWAVKNRLLAKRKYFGFGYHGIIQKNDGRYYQFSSFIPDDPNFKLLIDPFAKNNDKTTQSWFQAYDIAVTVIGGSVTDPTSGATFFHSKDFSQEEFVSKTVPGAIYLKSIGGFLFYQDPNETKK